MVPRSTRGDVFSRVADKTGVDGSDRQSRRRNVA